MQEQINSLLARMSKMETENVNTKGRVFTLAKQFRDTTKRQGYTLSRLFEEARILQAVALEVRILSIYAVFSYLIFVQSRPAAIAVIVRKQLDDARFCVADGFMAIFPYAFRAAQIMNPYELTQTTVEWESFRTVLTDYYIEHVKDDTGVKLQTLSVFTDCSCEALLNLNTEVYIDASHLPKFRPNARLWRYPILANNPEGKINIGDSDTLPTDENLFRQLQLFIPAFVWAFNLLKKAIFDEDVEIRRRKEKLREQHAFIVEAGGEPPECSSDYKTETQDQSLEARFLAGTGLELRSQSFWNAFVQDKHKDQQAATADLDLASLKRKREAIERMRLAKLYDVEGDEGGEMDMEIDSDRASHGSRASRHDNIIPSPPLPPQPINAPPPLPDDILDDENPRLASYRFFFHHHMSIPYDCEARREAHIIKFNSVRKCLSILLDVKLLNLAVFGASFCRIVTNYFVHKDQMRNDVAFANRHGGIQALVDAFPKKDDDAYKEERKTVVEDTLKLANLVYNSDAYVDDLKIDVEQAIDGYLLVESELVGDLPVESLSDVSILMAWMETIRPSPLKSSPEYASTT